MNIFKLSSILLLAISLYSLRAQANSSIEINQQEIDEIYLKSSVEFCYYDFLVKDDFYLSLLTKRLKDRDSSAFTSISCFKLNKLSKDSQEDAIHLIRAFGYRNAQNLDVEKLNSYSDESEEIENPEKIALQETLIQVAAGSAINKEMYEGQKDKKLHSNYGATISAGGSTIGYFVVKNSSLSEKNRERVVRYAGPISSLIVGILKEVLYDARNRDSHTVDAHDALATGIGGGIIPIKIEFKF